MSEQIKKGYLKGLLCYVLMVFFLIELYLNMSQIWVDAGGSSSGVFKFEIPFVVLLLVTLYFHKIRRKTVRYLLPVLLLFILYSAFDVFYGFLGRPPQPSDFHNFTMIFDFSPGIAFGGIAYLSVFFLSIILLIYHAYKDYPRRTLVFSLSWRLFVLLLLSLGLTSPKFIDFHAKSYEYGKWGHGGNVKKNGRFSSFIFYGNQEKQNRIILEQYSSKNIEVNTTLYPGVIRNPQNIHLIVLESFLDPRLLADIQFSKSPLSPDLTPYLMKTKGGFSHVISPVYGGDTAQAEFELLSGVSALSKINSIDFNVMRGGKASGFVSRLKETGYGVIATIATGTGYFNSTRAYKSLGMSNVYFLEEVDDFILKEADDKIYDGDLLQYNLRLVKDYLKNSEKPLFNYVLGMYGHLPYARNQNERPDYVEIDGADDRIRRISNQFYYRTREIAKYIEQLIAIDPNCIIFITSDHLPPVLDRQNKYIYDDKINIALLLNKSIPVDVSGKKYFEIPWLLWDLLSERNSERTLQDTEMVELYYKVLSESILPETEEEH